MSNYTDIPICKFVHAFALANVCLTVIFTVLFLTTTDWRVTKDTCYLISGIYASFVMAVISFLIVYDPEITIPENG